MVINILAALAVTLLLFILYRGIKGNTQAFSRENLGKSFTTLGMLALCLIAIIAFAILMLRK